MTASHFWEPEEYELNQVLAAAEDPFAGTTLLSSSSGVQKR